MKKTVFLLNITFLFLVSFICSLARGGGGGCDGECLPAPPTEILLTCQITNVSFKQNLPTGSHFSFASAEALNKQFQVGQTIHLRGGSFEDAPVAIYYASFATSKELRFSYYSLTNPPVTNAGVEPMRLYSAVTSSKSLEDFPLVHMIFLDFSVQNTKAVFSVVWRYETNFADHNDLTTLVGKMKCN